MPLATRSPADVAAAVGRRWRRALRRKVRFTPDIPVFIISRDRVASLAKLVSWLEAEGMRNIIIVDNDSTFPALVEYLAATPHSVVQLGRNVGHTAPWDTGLVEKLAKNRPFIVTDPDVVPEAQACGAIQHMCWLLNRHPDCVKVGLGLRIDDLSDHYEMKKSVIAHESRYWVNPVPGGAFYAPVDTTFALHRAGTGYCVLPALRTDAPFLARHDPWYMDSKNPPAEFVYYRDNASPSMTWGVSVDDTAREYQEPPGSTL